MVNVHIAVGAGFSNDRRDLGKMAAESLTTLDGPRYLVFECLAERTLALAQTERDKDKQTSSALSFLIPCIDICARANIRIISNFGGSDPERVALAIQEYTNEKDLPLSIAVVTGDCIDPHPRDRLENEISRNAYTGAYGIVSALDQGADIVVAGRVSDPSLVVGAVAYENKLDWKDWENLAIATLAGHLIECGTQVCGGYFSDIGEKQITSLADIGPPVASVDLSAGAVKISKPLGCGRVSEATVKEQLLYEIHNPSAYLTPDVVMDISTVRVAQTGIDEVTVSGVQGKPRPKTLKTLTCVDQGWIGEGEISYTGETSVARARMAQEILSKRLDKFAPELSRFFEIIGATTNDASLDDKQPSPLPHTRLRMAIGGLDKDLIKKMLDEVEALYLNGPAGGGGVRLRLDPRTQTIAGTIDQSDVVVAGKLMGETHVSA